MRLTLRKGEKYVIGKNIFYSWSKFIHEDTVPTLQPIDQCYRNHAMYVKVVRIKRLSSQFVEIEFEPVSKNINGDAHKCIFVVYDDNIVQLPDPYMNYVPESKLVKELVPANDQVEEIRQRIEAHYKDYTDKLVSLKEEMDRLTLQIEECKQTESEVRAMIDDEFTTLLDGLIIDKQEEDAYQKELVKYIDKDEDKNVQAN